MILKKTAAPDSDGSTWEPVRDALEVLEQAVAGGWYPARRLLLSRLASMPRPELPVWVPEADIEESPREFVVSFALPGVEKSDIRVEVREDEVTISGRRREEERSPASCRREQARGQFRRRVRLPAEVKPQTAKAVYRNGVLQVTLPRSKTTFGRSVKVD